MDTTLEVTSVRSIYEAFDTADRHAASDRAWKREGLPHWKQTPEEPFKPTPLAERPCPSLVEHTFANGDRVGRCLGTHRMRDGRIVPCVFAFGSENPSLNNRKHGPDLLMTADAVDGVNAEQEGMEELLAESPAPIAGADDSHEVEVENEDGTVATILSDDLEPEGDEEAE